jgi:hypothetical protein
VPSGSSPRGSVRRGGSVITVGDERNRVFPCMHCGAPCPCPIEIVRAYAGRMVRLQCPICGKLFDVQMPAKEDTSD